MYKKALLAVFTTLFVVLYMFSIAVVIMFLTSALHILKPELFQFSRFDPLTAAITVFIIAASLRTFLKIYRKYRSILEDIISRNRA